MLRSAGTVIDAMGSESSAQSGEHRPEPSVNMEGCRHADEPRDLRRRQVILESQREQHTVLWGEVFKLRGEPGVALAADHLVVGGSLARIGEQVDIHLGPERIRQSAAHRAERGRLVGVLSGTAAAVARTMMVEAEAAGRDRKPGRKRRATFCLEHAQPVIFALTQLFQDIGIPVHRLIAVAAERPRHGEEQAAMARDKIAPRGVAVRRIGRVENAVKLER